MKIFDCTTFYSEHLMMDVRFNVLNEHVHKFIVCESVFGSKFLKLMFPLLLQSNKYLWSLIY